MPLLSLLPLLGFSLATQRRFGLSASLSLMLSVSVWLVVVFVFGLVNLLGPAAIAVWSLGILVLAIEIPHVLKAMKARQFSPVFVLFPLFCLLFWSVHHSSQLFFYDEYSHWGVFIKDMWALDAFWQADSNTIHPRYLPGTAVWHYAFTVFAPETDASVYLAQFVLLLTPLLVLFDRLEWRQVPWMLAAMAWVVIGLANFGHGVASLYVDHLVSTWYAGVLLAVLLNPALSWRQLCLLFAPLLVLTLTKDVGVAFSLSAAGIIALVCLIRRWRLETKPRALLRSAFLGLVLIVPSLIAITLWSANRDAVGAEAGLHSLSETVSGVLAGERQLNDAAAALVTARYGWVFQHQQIAKTALSSNYNEYSFPLASQFEDRFRLTTLSAYLAFALVFVMLLGFGGGRSGRAEWGVVAALALFTAISYSAVLYATYQFAFAERGVLLPSYIRYTHSAVLALYLLVFAALLPAAGVITATVTLGAKRLPAGAAISGALLAALLLFETPYLRGFTSANPVVQSRADSEVMVSGIQQALGSRRLWVFFPVDSPNGFLGQVLQYQMSPTPTTVERSVSFLQNSDEAIRDALSAYDVLWFPVTNDEIDQRVTSVIGVRLDGRFVEVVDGPGDTVRFSLFEFASAP
ncbi:MAG: hypothetical protein AAF660_04930 [Pseudomonadota bacterium]